MRIKSLLQSIFLISLIGGLFACSNSENYSKAMNSWNGASERALFEKWGAPQETTKLPNGNTLYLYRVALRESAPVMYSPTYSRVSAQPGNSAILSQPLVRRNADRQTFWCDTWFEVNSVGMIVTTSYKGNNCVASKSYLRKIAS